MGLLLVAGGLTASPHDHVGHQTVQLGPLQLWGGVGLLLGQVLADGQTARSGCGGEMFLRLLLGESLVSALVNIMMFIDNSITNCNTVVVISSLMGRM